MKKGFATSAIFYTVFVLFLVLMVSILSNLQNKKTILDNIKLETIEALDYTCGTVTEELNAGKQLIAQALTNIGITTSSTDSFEEMASSINNISTKETMVYLGRFTFASTAAHFTTGTIDISSKYENYKNITMENIYIVPYRIQLGKTYASWVSGDASGVGLTFTNTYNATNGVISIQATGTNTAGSNIAFGFGNATWQTMLDVYVLEK